MKKKRPAEAARAAPRAAASLACVTSIDGGRATLLEMRAQPGAKRAGFGGFWNGLPKISVGAPPEDGRANAEIAVEIAALLGLRASAVELVGGATSRVKRFRLACAPGAVEARLHDLERAHGLDARKKRRS
jgi:uncharacterized protein YggU (UPF0235/DUF167 family)